MINLISGRCKPGYILGWETITRVYPRVGDYNPGLNLKVVYNPGLNLKVVYNPGLNLKVVYNRVYHGCMPLMYRVYQECMSLMYRVYHGGYPSCYVPGCTWWVCYLPTMVPGCTWWVYYSLPWYPPTHPGYTSPTVSSRLHGYVATSVSVRQSPGLKEEESPG